MKCVLALCGITPRYEAFSEHVGQITTLIRPVMVTSPLHPFHIKMQWDEDLDQNQAIARLKARKAVNQKQSYLKKALVYFK